MRNNEPLPDDCKPDYIFAHPKNGQAANQHDLGVIDTNYDYETIAYAHNVFYDTPPHFGSFESNGTYHSSIQSFKNALDHYKVLSAHVGEVVTEDPVKNAAAHDFRLSENSPAIDKGARVFVPFPLYMMIGEYNFHLNNTNPAKILDNHWYVAPYYYNGRKSYRYMPRFPLEAVNVSAENFIDGALEDWTKSALQLNGTNQYAYIPHEKMSSDTRYPLEKNREGIIPGRRIRNADMDDNNFLLEI